MTDQFIKERRYLKAVTPKTEAWYRDSFKAFAGTIDSKAAIVQRISELTERGVKPVCINSYSGLRVLNTYFHWRDGNGEKCSPQCTHLRMPRLKEEQKILSTFSSEQIKRLVNWKPIGRNETRAHRMTMVALDTGLRVSEILGLSRQTVDLDNFVLRVHGKGNKHRLVPMTVELRKVLYRQLSAHNHALVFGTRSGTAASVRNTERDFKVTCGKAGISGVRASWHTIRHSFAVNYLRAGGNLYYLQRILGHSSITTTERYLKSLGIEDLQKVHNGLSLLNK